MVRKIFCLFLFVTSPAWLQAQVSLSVQLPPGGMIQKDQLWNIIAMNSGNTGLDAVFQLNLQDASTGQIVLSGVTRNINLSPGVRNFRAQDLQPIQYNYGAAVPDGPYIPLGAYTACYTASRFTTESVVPVITECVRINITPLSPPLLTLPADGSTLATPYPQFSWTPPAPLNMFSDLSYDLHVVEVLDGQSAAEAISGNLPLYSRPMLHTVFDQYSVSYSPLEKGKVYAWQVTARSGMSYSSSTEVWTFRVGEDSVVTPLGDNLFFTFKNDGMTSGIVHILRSRELRIKYRSYAGRYTGGFRFLDNTHKLVGTAERTIANGDNYLLFELSKKILKNKVYTVEFVDERRKISSISFIIQ